MISAAASPGLTKVESQQRQCEHQQWRCDDEQSVLRRIENPVSAAERTALVVADGCVRENRGVTREPKLLGYG